MTDTRLERESPPGGESPSATGEPSSGERLTASAGVLLLRQVLAYTMTAASSMFVVRALEPDVFGRYASGLAASTLFLGLTDFGFGQYLARRVGTARSESGELPGALVRRIVAVHLMWTGVVGLVAGGAAFLWAGASVSGLVLALMVPSIAVSGCGSLRQVCYWRHAVKPLARVDLSTTLVQSVCLVLLAWGTGSVLLLALVMSLSAIANSVLVARLGLRLLPPRASGQDDEVAWGGVPLTRRQVLAASLPLGLALFVPSAYYHADMLMAQALTDAESLGHYAAAVKFLSIFAMLPTVVMALALPHLAFAGLRETELADLVGQILRWFASLLLPLCAAIGAFAPLLVHTVYGSAYAASAPLLSLLMGGAAIGLLGNVVGTVLVAEGRATWLFRQNLLALAVNVAGNIVLLPRWGVGASAALTLLTEAMVTFGSLIALRHRLDLWIVPRVVRPGALAIVPIVVLGALWGDSWLAAAVAGLACLAVLTAVDGWPPDLKARFPWRRTVVETGSGEP